MASNGNEGTRGSEGGKGGQGQSAQFTLKLLAPEAFSPAIIGKGGAVIGAMRTSCAAKLSLSDKGEVYPSTDCRIFTAQAETAENLDEVIRQIIAKLAEVAKAGNVSDAVGVEGALKLKALVPRAAAGGVIGKGGAAVRQLTEESGAKISIGEAVGLGPGAEQLVAVSGTAEALEHVFLEVNKQIQRLASEPWFAIWAASRPVQAGYPGAASVAGYRSPALQTMAQVASSLPAEVTQDSRGFAISCVVPSRLVGGLIGRGGQGTKEVQMLTQTKISIRDLPDDPENRSLHIVGPLTATCTAYMLMMKRYLDAESQATSASR